MSDLLVRDESRQIRPMSAVSASDVPKLDINPFSGTVEKTDGPVVDVNAIMSDLEKPRRVATAEPAGVDDVKATEFAACMTKIKAILKESDARLVATATTVHEETIGALSQNVKNLRMQMSQNRKMQSDKCKSLDAHVQRRLNVIRDIKEEKDGLIAENKRLRQKVKDQASQDSPQFSP